MFGSAWVGTTQITPAMIVAILGKTPEAGKASPKGFRHGATVKERGVAVTFHIETSCLYDVDALFDISLSIDAHLEAFADSRESAVAGIQTGAIGLDETVTWRARHFGVWFVMTSRITSLEPHQRFVDEQVDGPFRVFVHEHQFWRSGGRTYMRDVVTVGSPIAGPLIDRLVLVPYMRRLIGRRNRSLLRRLAAGDNGEGTV